MPRGSNPNSRANLKTPSSKEARKNGSKGGKASAQKRKEYASFQECFNAMMDDEKREKLFNMLLTRAEHGNLKAFEILRDTMGEKPTEHTEVAFEDDGLLAAIGSNHNIITGDMDMIMESDDE